MNNGVRFEGMPVKLGGVDYILPPLSFKQIRTMKTQIELLAKVRPGEINIPAEALEGVVALIHAALTRNYKDLKIDEVEECVDIGNAPKLIRAMMGVSGFERPSPGETAAASPSTGN